MFAAVWQLSAGRLTIRHLFLAWLALIIYAALDEWAQSFVGRASDYRDWLADGSGAAVGLLLFAWLRRRGR